MFEHAHLIQPLAEFFWGKPAKAGKKPRWGRNLSRTIDPEAGTWHSFKTNEGGGVFDLVRVEAGLADNTEARQWLISNGWIQASEATPEQRQRAKARAKQKFEDESSYYRTLLRRIEIEEAKGELKPQDQASKADALAKLDELEGKHGLKKTPRQRAVEACYKHKAFRKPEGLAAAAEEAGMTLAQTEQHFMNHLCWKYSPLHNSIKPAKTFSSFEKALEQLIKTGQSAFIQAPQGTGKTSAIGKPLVDAVKKRNQQVIAATVLRSLADQNAHSLNLDSDRETSEVLSLSEGVSATIHSMSTERLIRQVQQISLHGGSALLDEVAKIASLLAASESIISGEKKSLIIDALKNAAQGKAQIVGMDADVTPETAALLKVLGLTDAVWKVTEQPYALPGVEFHPNQYNKEGTERPLLDEIRAKLEAGEQIAIACTDRTEAEALEALFSKSCTGKSLLLTSDTSGLKEQADFLSRSNEAAKDYQLIVYSPVLSAGFSVTSVEPNIYCMVGHDHLQAPEILQMLRRFRRAKGGVVKVEVPIRLQSATRHYNPSIACEILEDTKTDNLDDLEYFEQAMVASLQQKNLNSSNPYLAMLGHFANSGIKCKVVFKGGGVEAGKDAAEAKAEAKNREVQAVATAPEADLIEIAHLEQSGANTPDSSAKLKRHQITQALLLTYDDLEPDGSLPELLVQGYLHNRLASRVNHQALTELNPRDLLVMSINQDARRRFAFKKHTWLQVEVAKKIIKAAGDRYTGDDARVIADTYRNEIKSYWRMVPKPPRKGAKGNKAFTEWLQGLLHKFGYTVKSKKVGSVRFKTVTKDALVATYASRKAEHFAAEIEAANAKFAAEQFRQKPEKQTEKNRHEKPPEAA